MKQKNFFSKKNFFWKQNVKNEYSSIYSNLHLECSKNILFFANRYGIVKSININNGKEIWNTNLSTQTSKFPFHRKSAQLSGGITFHKNCIYIGSEQSKLYALKSKNGNVVWETNIFGEILSDPVITDKIILVHSNIGILHAINRNNGTIKWITNFGTNSLINLRGASKPAVISNFILIGDKNGFINILEKNNGKILWKKYIIKNRNHDGSILINDIQSSIVTKNNIAYILAYSNNFVAIDLFSKMELWHKNIGSTKDFLIHLEKIYIIDNIDRIYSINIENGKILWKQNMLLHKHLTSPSIYDNKYIILGDYNGNLYWISINDGSIVFKKKISNSGIISKPIFYKKKIFIQTTSEEIYMLEQVYSTKI